MPQKAWIFVKFGQRKYLEEIQKGILYMNSWQYFKYLENEAQKDIYEGSLIWLNPSISTIKIGDRVLTRENGTLCASLSFPMESIKIFCMSVICRGDQIRSDFKIFDDRMRNFGDSFLVIYNANRFLKRVDKALEINLKKEIFVSADYGKVEYFKPNEYDGDVGPFRKIDYYKYQKEFRIVICKSSKKPFKLSVGSLEDISILDSVSNFINVVKQKRDLSGFNLLF